MIGTRPFTTAALSPAIFHPCIHRRFNELSLALVCSPPAYTSADQPSWIPPPLFGSKINVDAAISTSHACLAAVARDHHGVPLKILARITKVASPLLAESEALLWAVQLAIREGWNHGIFEGDAKSCFDAVNSPDLPSPWIIRTSTENILALHFSFLFCSFVCVRRACNSAAHNIVKFA